MSDKNTPTQKTQYPSEMIDLPSGGKMYSKESPLRSGQVEVKYMTAREEDILTSANLIKKGIVVDRLLDALILTSGVKIDDFQKKVKYVFCLNETARHKFFLFVFP